MRIYLSGTGTSWNHGETDRCTAPLQMHQMRFNRPSSSENLAERGKKCPHDSCLRQNKDFQNQTEGHTHSANAFEPLFFLRKSCRTRQEMLAWFLPEAE
jgi:hypothetical protein